LEWSELTLEQLSKLKPEVAEQVILKYQQHLIDKGVCANTIRVSISPLKTFFKFCRIPIDLTNNVVEMQNASEYHAFRSEDLKRLFNAGTTKDRALLSVLASSGQSISDVLALERSFIEEQLKGDVDFIFFDTQRIKTGKKGLFALNPIAIRCLKKYLYERIDNDKRLLPWSRDGVRKMLLRLKRESGFESSRNIRIHKIRGWFISTCISAGLVTEEWKILTSKAIKASDETYIRIRESLEQKYKSIFKEHLDFLGQSQVKTIEHLQRQVKALTNLLREKPPKTVTEEPDLTELEKMRIERDGWKHNFELLLERVEKLEKLQKKETAT